MVYNADANTEAFQAPQKLDGKQVTFQHLSPTWEDII